MSQGFRLCIVNTSKRRIIKTKASVQDPGDWDDNTNRPDINFTDAVIDNYDSKWEHEELKDLRSTAPFTMKLYFDDDTDLSFTNNAWEAQGKENRDYPCVGSAVQKLRVYQTVGNWMNAFYVRTREEPNNGNWMGDLLQHKPNVRLNELTIPGSHDAAMCKTAGCILLQEIPGLIIQPAWAKTQSCNILEQLQHGTRYFDFRVYWASGEFRLGHFGGFGGCFGPQLWEVLAQVVTFMNTGTKETVILKFSHTAGDGPGEEEAPSVIAYSVVQKLKDALQGVLYTTQNKGANIAKTRLSELSGKVVAVFDVNDNDQLYQQYYDVTKGIFPYRGYDQPGYGLRVHDKYSDTSDYSAMSKDQLDKLSELGGYENDYLFLLSWTLTGTLGHLDIQALSAQPNAYIPHITTGVQKGTYKHPNIIFYDYIDPYINEAIINLNRGTKAPVIGSGTPLADIIEKIQASTAGDLVNQVFATAGTAPGLPFGQFDSQGSTVTATADSGYYKILLELGGGDQQIYPVTMAVIFSATVALSEWDWYQNAASFAGTRQVWTSSGWETIPDDKAMSGTAAGVDGLYYYRITMNNVPVGGSLGAFVASQNQPTTVTAYKAKLVTSQ